MTLRAWTTDERHFFRIENGHCSLRVLDWNTQEVPAGWVADNGECLLYVTWMGRQDGRTSWGVMFTEIDGAVRARTGLTERADDCEVLREAEASINEAIFELARCEQWVA